MYHEDGSVLSPRKWPWQKDTLAFGWLDPRHPFREGPCPSEVRRGLIDKAIPPVWPDGTPAPIDTDRPTMPASAITGQATVDPKGVMVPRS